MGDDLCVGAGARLDDLAGEEVGVDDGEGVGRLGEEGGDGGFAGRDGAGEADEEHGLWGGGGGEWGGLDRTMVWGWKRSWF